MPTSIEVFPGKSIYIKTAFASKRTFTFISTINNNCSQLNTFYTERKIHQPFCIACLNIIFYKVRLWYSNKCSIIFIKYFHAVQQNITKKSETLFKKIIKKVFMNLAMLKASIFKICYHPVNI